MSSYTYLSPGRRAAIVVLALFCAFGLAHRARLSLVTANVAEEEVIEAEMNDLTDMQEASSSGARTHSDTSALEEFSQETVLQTAESSFTESDASEDALKLPSESSQSSSDTSSSQESLEHSAQSASSFLYERISGETSLPALNVQMEQAESSDEDLSVVSTESSIAAFDPVETDDEITDELQVAMIMTQGTTQYPLNISPTFSIAHNASMMNVDDVRDRVHLRVVDASGAVLPVDMVVNGNTSGYRIMAVPQRRFVPGAYRLMLSLSAPRGISRRIVDAVFGTTDSTVLFDDNVNFGSFVWNTDKASYAPGQIAYAGLSVADGERCGDWSMTVQDTTGGISQVSASGSTNGAHCGPRAFVSSPLAAGDHVVTLTDGEQSDARLLSVTDDQPVLSVRREGEIEIHAGGDVDMIIHVAPRVSFTGTITDLIPAGLQVTSRDAGVDIDDDHDAVRITWNGQWNAGDVYALSYRIAAPEDQESAILLLGPLEAEGNISLLEEAPTNASVILDESSSASAVPVDASESILSSAVSSDIVSSLSGASSSESVSPDIEFETSSSNDSSAASVDSAGTESDAAVDESLQSWMYRIPLIGDVIAGWSDQEIKMNFSEERMYQMRLVDHDRGSYRPSDTRLMLEASHAVFDANSMPSFTLVDTEISSNDILDANGNLKHDIALAEIVRASLTQEDIERQVAKAILKHHSDIVAGSIMNDSAAVTLVRNTLGEAESRRTDKVEQAVRAAVESDDGLAEDLADAMLDDQVAARMVENVMDEHVVDAVLMDLAAPAEDSRVEIAIEQALIDARITVDDAAGTVASALLPDADAMQNVADALVVDESAASDVKQDLIRVMLRDANGNSFSPSYHFRHGSVVLVIEPDRAFAPGLYTLMVTVTNPLTGQEQQFEQDFAWGVLAINPDRDVYRAGDRAMIDIGVLDDHGEIVCDADVTLNITAPDGTQTALSTTDGSIVVTDTCARKEAGFIEPDYRAFFTVAQQGVYQLSLTATTQNGTRSLETTLTAQDNPAIIVRRTAATRLWPFAPSPMTVQVTANEDFSGDIVDVLPMGFVIDDISPQARVSVLEGTGTIITWKHQFIPAGETRTYEYIYDAPDISPQFYLIGPLTGLDNDGSISFAEERSWQIANDGDGVINIRTWDNGGGDGLWSTAANWTSNTAPDSDDIAYFDATSTANATIDATFQGMLNSMKVSPAYTGTITVGRNLTLSGGSLTLSGGTLTFGNAGRTLTTNRDVYTYPAATLIAGTGTIALTGTGTSHVLSSTGALHNLVLNNGLIGYWKFDEGQGTAVRDSSGLSKHGTLNNGQPWSTTIPSVDFYNPMSLNFDGTDDYVSISDSTNPLAYSVSAWVRPDTTGTQNIVCYTGGASCTGTWSHQLRINSSGTFEHYTNAGGGVTISGSTVITAGQWYHVTITARSGENMRLFVNGTQVASTAIGTLWQSGSAWHIAAASTGFANFNGHVDDVRIYSRALSSSEIQMIYNGSQATGSGVYALGSTLDVNGNLTIAGSTLDASASNYGISLAGNMLSSGQFTKRSSTFTLDGAGTQTLSGSTIFHNLYLNTSTARTLFADHTSQQSVSGALTLRGTNSQNISLRSTRSGSGARITLDASGTQNIRYGNIKDSNAGGGTLLACTVGCTDSGNNTNWNIGTPAVWDGGGADTNCSTSGNWSDNTIPTTSSSVVFNDTSTKNITWDASCPTTVSNFTMDAGYTGTGTISGRLTVSNDMVLGSGTVVTAQGASGAIMIGGNMTMGADGKIVVRYSSISGGGSGQLITVGGNLTVGTGAIITADGKGFAANAGPGKGTSSVKVGGHGGVGNGYNGSTDVPDGSVYGSVTNPTSLGSGGGSLAGGGAIILRVAGISIINGLISANSDYGSNGHQTGAGGSINLTTTTLSGAGILRANSFAYGGGGGAGGGGRIAVILTSGTSFGAVSMQAYGGSQSYIGSAGTVYRKAATQAYGELIIDNNNQNAGAKGYVSNSPAPVDTPLPSGMHLRLDNLIVRNRGMLTLPSNSTLTLHSQNVSATSATSSGSVRLNGGTLSLASGSLTIGNRVNIFVDTGSILNGNVTVASGGLITHTPNGTWEHFKAILNITGNLEVQVGGAISADNVGYVGNSGPGKGTLSLYKAAGHGGLGIGYGTTYREDGATYGSPVAPINLGSGGNSSGGGAVIISVSGNTLVSGRISADVTSGGPGTGAGGSVYLTTGSLTGTGTISASEKVFTNACGGGGRVAVILTVGTSFGSVSTRAHGGSCGSIYSSGAGTVYLKKSTQTYGDLIIDNNNISSTSVTPLYSYSSTGVTVGSLILRNKAKFLISADDSLVLAGSGTALLVNSGATLINSNILTIGGTGATIRSFATFTQSGSAVVNYTGQSNDAAVTVGSGTYKHIGFNNAGTTFSLPAAATSLHIDGNMTLTGGTLALAGTQALHVNGSWRNTGGTFSAGSGTVFMTGSGTITEPSSFYNLSIADPRLTGYWKFDETSGTSAIDSSGNSRTATHVNGPTISTDVPSTITYPNVRSIDFDGVDDYLSVPSVSSELTGSFTAAAWVKYDSFYNTIEEGYNTIFGTSSFYKFYLGAYKDAGGRKVSAWINNAANIVTTTGLTAGDWYHIAYVQDLSSMTGKIYINGVLAKAGTTVAITSPGTFYIGNQGGHEIDGKIDDVRFYSRILSASEIASLASGQHAPYTQSSNVDVNGNLLIRDKTMDSGAGNYSFTVGGNWNNEGTFTKRSGTVNFNGAGNQTISGSTLFHNLTATGSRTLFFSHSGQQSVSGALVLQGNSTTNRLNLRSTKTGSGGNLLLGSAGTQTLHYLDVKDADASGGTTLNCSTGCLNSGNNTNWLFPWSGRVYTDKGNTSMGANKTVAMSVNGAPATTVETDSSGNFLLNVTTASGDIIALYLDDETENAALITRTDGVTLGGMDLYKDRLIVRAEAGGNITPAMLSTAATVGDTDLTDFYTANTGIVTSVGTELLVWTGSTLRPGGTLAADDLDVRGSLVMGGRNIGVSGSVSGSRGRIVQTGAILMTSASNETITLSGSTIGTVQMTGGGTYTLSGALRVNSNLRVQSGLLDLSGFALNTTSATFRNDDRLRLRGSETLTGFANDTSSGTVIFNGSSSYTGLNGMTTFRHLSFSGAGMWTLNSAVTVNGNLALSGGTLDVSASNYAISVHGWDARPITSFVPRRGTVTFAGTGTVRAYQAFSGVLLNARGKTLTVGTGMLLSGNMTISGGTLKVPDGQQLPITLSGTWLQKSVGSLSPGSGTVIFDSGTNQTLSGSTTFWNLKKSVTTASTWTFAAGTTQTVRGRWTAQGALGESLRLRSSTTGTQWKISPENYTLQYIDVRDSNNLHASTILASEDAVNSGNNTNWAFPISVTVLNGSGTALAGQTVAMAVNGGSVVYSTTNGSGIATFNDGVAEHTVSGVGSGSLLAMWISGEDADGFTAAITNGTTLSYTIRQDTLTAQSQDGGPITSNDLVTAIETGSGSTDVTNVFSMSGAELVMQDGTTFRIETSTTFNQSDAAEVDDIRILGTYNMSTHAVTVHGSWDASGGSFTGDNTVTFDSQEEETITVNASSFSNVVFVVNNDPSQGVGQWTTTDDYNVTGTQSVQNGGVDPGTDPVISDIAVDPFYDEVGIVTWTTDVAADSTVRYGTNSLSLTSSATGSSLVRDHTVTLQGLSPATTYYVRVVSSDFWGNTATGDLISFTTLENLSTAQELAQAVAAAQAAATTTSSGGGGGGSRRNSVCSGSRSNALTVSNAEVDHRSDGLVTIRWEASAKAIAIVQYGIEAVDDLSATDLEIFSMEQSVTLKQLAGNTTYRYRVISVDECGNTAFGEEGTFTSSTILESLMGSGSSLTPEAVNKRYQDFLQSIFHTLSLAEFKSTLAVQVDTLQELAKAIPGPALGGEPKVQAFDTYAVIEWTTDEPANSIVMFAPDSLYAAGATYTYRTEGADNNVTQHSVTVNGLTPGTLYHFAVRSETPFGTSTDSRDFTFVTSQQSVSILNYSVEILSPTSAAFSWNTNVPTSSSVTFIPYRNGVPSRETAWTVRDGEQILSHTIVVTDIESGVFYDLELSGISRAGVIVLKTIPRFNTSPEDADPTIFNVQTDTALVPGKDSKIQTVISWQTNDQTIGTVWYQRGVSTDTANQFSLSVASESNYSKKHLVLLPSLDPGVIYSFQVESADSAGNITRSPTYTILTPRQEQGVIEVIMHQMQSAFGWIGNIRR